MTPCASTARGHLSQMKQFVLVLSQGLCHWDGRASGSQGPGWVSQPAGDSPEGRDSWLLWGGGLGSEEEAHGMLKDLRDH